MLFLVLLVAVPIAVLVFGVRTYRSARGRATRTARAVRVAVPMALAAGVGYALAFPGLVGQITSSTAGLSYLGLPLIMTVVAVAAGAVAWGLTYVVLVALGQPRAPAVSARAERPALVAAVLLALGSVVGAVELTRFQRYYAIARDPRSSSAELRGAYNGYARRSRLYEDVFAPVLLRTANNSVPARLAVHDSLPEEVWRALIVHPNASVSGRAWRNPIATPARLAGLADAAGRNGDVVTLGAIARHERTPPEVLRTLAARGDVDASLWTNPALPADVAAAILPRLVVAPSETVRATLAASPRVSADDLERLARDTSQLVVESVARNRIAPAAVLERLAADPRARIRFAVASNWGAPDEVLARLTTDSVSYISSMAGISRQQQRAIRPGAP